MPTKEHQEAMKIPLDIQLKAAGLGGYVMEHRFHPKRRWRFDLCWESKMVALELEGGIWNFGRHTRGSGYQKDCHKYNEAALHGWLVIRATTEMVNDGSAVEYLKRAMEERA